MDVNIYINVNMILSILLATLIFRWLLHMAMQFQQKRTWQAYFTVGLIALFSMYGLTILIYHVLEWLRGL